MIEQVGEGLTVLTPDEVTARMDAVRAQESADETKASAAYQAAGRPAMQQMFDVRGAVLLHEGHRTDLAERLVQAL